ncbi:hypothetical protein KCP71_00100 [Salmonella enterica subsp. enterica]|nr:hypothetical protein KCP71_00100 [Salmonella enterica subsp. enterica]
MVDILDEVLAEYPHPGGKAAGVTRYVPGRCSTVKTDLISATDGRSGHYWWFEHSEDSHTLVLADAISARHSMPDSPLVEWHRRLAEAGQGAYPHWSRKTRVRGPASGCWMISLILRSHVHCQQTRWQNPRENRSCHLRAL